MSQKTKHTDSPWTFDVDAYGYPNDIMAADGWPFARAIAYYPFTRVKEEMLSYVRLATAAPDLLWALQQIIQDLPSKRDWLDPDVEKIARAAIAKAKGEA